MKKMFLLFSHKLTEVQVKEAKEKYNVDEFFYLPRELQNIWSNIPAEIEHLIELLKPIKEFLKQNVTNGDIVLIQGDFGAVYNLVNFAKEKKLVVLYATTVRKIQEYQNTKGENVKKSIFEHRRFREYE